MNDNMSPKMLLKLIALCGLVGVALIAAIFGDYEIVTGVVAYIGGALTPVKLKETADETLE